MHEIDDEAEAMKDCARCGGRAFYWRTAVVAGDPQASQWRGNGAPRRQPAWTCMNCGYIEPHERRESEASPPQAQQRHLYR
jgi:predicted nucleic-acid-binding Zn-ribbon protein